MTSAPPIDIFYPSIYWQGLGKHVVDTPSVGILRCSKNLVDARDKKYRQRAESLSLASASVVWIISMVVYLLKQQLLFVGGAISEGDLDKERFHLMGKQSIG